MRLSALHSDMLRYIVEKGYQPGDQLPTIQEIGEELGVSVAKTRESMEVARALGVVEIKPGRGTRVAEYRFAPAVALSALYAIGQNTSYFEHLNRMRNALEICFWEEAVGRLRVQDMDMLRSLIAAATERLESQPIQIPDSEHRAFHLTIFSRLDNPFVQGVLEAFWEAYEAFGLTLYMELNYHRMVWAYHKQLVDAIETGDVETGRRLLIDHMNLLHHRELAEEGVSDVTLSQPPHPFE